MVLKKICSCECHILSYMEDGLKLSTSENVYVNVRWYSKRNVHVSMLHGIQNEMFK
jgi:hypothetical protein